MKRAPSFGVHCDAPSAATVRSLVPGVSRDVCVPGLARLFTDVSAESRTVENLGRPFGFHRSVDTLGAVFGPLLAFCVLGLLGGDLRLVFALAFIPGIASLLLIGLVGETGRGCGERRGEKASHFAPAGGYWVFLGVSMLFALGNSSDAFLVLRAGDLGPSTQQVVLAYTLLNAAYLLLSMPFLRSGATAATAAVSLMALPPRSSYVQS
ncbi:MAG: hypothetical protein ACM3US_09200 [Sphingomonadaceae bacterium]